VILQVPSQKAKSRIKQTFQVSWQEKADIPAASKKLKESESI
jgi:hypothetical protein